MFTPVGPSPSPQLPPGWVVTRTHDQVSILSDGLRQVGFVKYRAGVPLWWWRIHAYRLLSSTPRWSEQLAAQTAGGDLGVNPDAFTILVSVPNRAGFAIFPTEHGWVKILAERHIASWLNHLSASSVNDRQDLAA